MHNLRLQVAPGEAGRPLLDFLAAHCACSRRHAKELLDQRLVFVNGRRVWMARHRLQARDAIDLPPAARAAAPAGSAPPILYQDRDYLVANKPAGILANGPHSLETRLQSGLNLPGLAAVHRLDRGTSGCLLCAKNPAAQQAARLQFAARKIEKIYRALVAGPVRQPHFTITHPIAGQAAITEVQVLDANRRASHLRIALRTGRTHQIRKHLLAIGHPILGEPFYAPRREVGPLERRFRRPMLHAFQLNFIQPLSGAAVRCTAPLPADFRQGLAWLGLADGRKG